MKKVMCINTGKQTPDHCVIIGNIYTVISEVRGGEVGLYHRSEDIFYILVEMGNDRCYYCGLFAEIEEAKNMAYKNEMIEA